MSDRDEAVLAACEHGRTAVNLLVLIRNGVSLHCVRDLHRARDEFATAADIMRRLPIEE